MAVKGFQNDDFLSEGNGCFGAAAAGELVIGKTCPSNDELDSILESVFSLDHKEKSFCSSSMILQICREKFNGDKRMGNDNVEGDDCE